MGYRHASLLIAIIDKYIYVKISPYQPLKTMLTIHQSMRTLTFLETMMKIVNLSFKL